MADELSVPGVFIDDNRAWPPTIAELPTAVPAFIGYTAHATADTGEPLLLTPTRISSAFDYARLFGGPPPELVTVALRTNRQRAGGVEVTEMQPQTGSPAFLLAWAVRHYFDNGGTECVVVSVGDYSVPAGPDALLTGISAADTDPAITLLVAPDAAVLPTWSAFATVTAALLEQRGRAGGRFAVLDVWRGDLPMTDTVNVADPEHAPSSQRVIEASRNAWAGNLGHVAAYYPFLVTAYPRLAATPDAEILVTEDDGEASTLEAVQARMPQQAAVIRKALAEAWVVLPPSGAVAGVYARTDATRGVWKAPSNVSVNAVARPSAVVTDTQQQSLTIDANGESVNAVRAFTGKGTLVWGARTLAGNDNEWRYVSVRRLVDFIERSVLASTSWVAFEPNDANTWSALTASIEHFLTTLWRRGALTGAKPEEAFWVRCGLGQTMTQADIASGRLLVTLALAPIRPAEFLLLGLTYAVQDA